MGDLRARPHLAVLPARHRHRSLRRGHRTGLRPDRRRLRDRRRRLSGHRQRHQRRLRPHRLRPGPGGPGGHRGRGLRLLAGRPAPGRAVAALRRVLAGPGRRRPGDGQPLHLPRVQQPARTRPRRQVQALLGRRRRHRVQRGRRPAAGRAPVGRAAQRPPGARPRPRHRRQPGRRLQRTDRTQRPLPTTGDPPGPHQRRCPCVRSGRRGRTRHRHHARRPDRGARVAGDVRPGTPGRAAVVAGFREIEPGTHAGRCGCGGCHEDGAGAAARGDAQVTAYGFALVARGLVGGCGGAAVRGA